jgi:very-short-patch-repair endonuclease
MRKNMTTQERCKIADEISKTIVVRDYINGSSRDTRRETTEKERKILYNVVLAALNTLNYTAADENGVYDIKTHAILNTAEYMFMRFINDPVDGNAHANSYDSIYNPLAKVIRDWEEE